MTDVRPKIAELPPLVTKLGDRAWTATPDTVGRRLSNGQWTAPPHLRLLCWMLYLLSTGYLRRLTASFPPGHGKSECSDVWFPIWNLEHRPADRMMMATYESTFAEEWGKKVRQIIADNQDAVSIRLRDDSQAANRWRTKEGGGLWTLGAGGAVTGRRARTFVIDDIHKNYADAHSERSRSDVINWYRSTARTRLLPGGVIGMIGTRWHPEDLIGTVNESMPGLWVNLVMPAVAEQDETLEEVLTPRFVRRCQRDGVALPPWSRRQGEPLWPWLVAPKPGTPGIPWFGTEELSEVRAELGPYIWNGMYQQHPAPLDGELFKREQWRRVDVAPAGSLTLVRRWDLAATEGGGDYTAGVLMGRHFDGRLFVLDARRARLEGVGVERLIYETAVEDRENYGRVRIRLEQEPGSAGKTLAQHYVRNVLAGFEVSAEGSSGDKVLRSVPFASQQQAGNVYLVRRMGLDGYVTTPQWHEWYVDEHSQFPSGKNDDAVDASSNAYNDLVSLMTTRRRARAKTMAARQVIPMKYG
jgi:predicted phage terminase large subunit-like protein